MPAKNTRQSPSSNIAKKTGFYSSLFNLLNLEIDEQVIKQFSLVLYTVKRQLDRTTNSACSYAELGTVRY